MKFQLRTSSYFYPSTSIAKYEQLGFSFTKTDRAQIFAENHFDFEYVIDGRPSIEFQSLEQLMDFTRQFGRVIVSQNQNGVDCLEIYDGDRE